MKVEHTMQLKSQGILQNDCLKSSSKAATQCISIVKFTVFFFKCFSVRGIIRGVEPFAKFEIFRGAFIATHFVGQ